MYVRITAEVSQIVVSCETPIQWEQFCLVFITNTYSIWYFIQFVHIAIFMSYMELVFQLLKYIHTEVVNSYNEVHTYSIVITLHACGLWNMPPYRPSVGSYSCISGCEYFEVYSMP